LVLNAVRRLYKEFYKIPVLVPNNELDERWKWFKGCLGALDGTYVKEGSAADSRVLRDATSRSNRLKVTYGNYYLCDAGYINGKGFLTPYRSQRYHLSDWSHPPMTSKEFYNKRHSSARNLDMTNSSLPSGVPASRLPRGAGKNKRVWTANEDVKLIDALMELHKSSKYSGGDNGFKPGYDKAVQTLLDVSL
ncbi:hypothetical protein Tco_1519200, partial [Tanacetum coccineum]